MGLPGRRLLLFLFLTASAQAAPFTSLIDFGDSLSDAGNVYNLTSGIPFVQTTPGKPGYSNGRFSNGNIWVQDLGVRLGLGAVSASSAGGTDFAYGGVTTGTGNTDLLLPNVEQQVNNWAASNHATAGQLFTILGGGNDLFGEIGSADTPAQQAAIATQAAANIAACIQTLYNDGARNVVVANLPDLGQVPRYRGTSQQAQATSLSTSFNNALVSDITTLTSTTAGLNLRRLDLFSLFQQVIAKPLAFGLTDVKDRAYSGDDNFVGNGTAVDDPSGYLFWDAVHPTATGHALIANAAYALVVPEPTRGGIVFATLILLAAVRSRRLPTSGVSRAAIEMD